MQRKALIKLCSTVVSLGLSVLSLCLLYRTSSPTCSVQGFYLPDLNKTLNAATAARPATNTTIYFDVELDNPNERQGIYYNTLNLTFYYKSSSSNQTYFAVANKTFVGFYQGRQNKAHRTGTVKSVGVPWGEVRRRVSNGSTPVFRVELVTSFRFKVFSWRTKKHDWVVGADVAVNGSGEKDKQEGIRFTSGAPEIRFGQTRPLVIGGIILFSLFSITI